MTTPTTPPKRVLIADDEHPLAHALELKLQHEGYDTVAVSDGQACLKKLASDQFDILLLDLMMPVMDGFSVLEQLGTVSKPPVVFALSGLRQHEDEKRALGLGAQKYFVKSEIPLETIVDAVKKA